MDFVRVWRGKSSLSLDTSRNPVFSFPDGWSFWLRRRETSRYTASRTRPCPNCSLFVIFTVSTSMSTNVIYIVEDYHLVKNTRIVVCRESENPARTHWRSPEIRNSIMFAVKSHNQVFVLFMSVRLCDETSWHYESAIFSFLRVIWFREIGRWIHDSYTCRMYFSDLLRIVFFCFENEFEKYIWETISLSKFCLFLR